MPAYDCGDPTCDECKRAFGPDRRKAIENFERREIEYAAYEQRTREFFAAQAARR